MNYPYNNPKWNKYEIAILVDAYLKVSDGVIPKKEAINVISMRLRGYMIKKKVLISDTYRNNNGITLQMGAVEYLFTDGQHGVKHVSNLIREIVELYQNDRGGFCRLVTEANLIY